MKDDTDFKCSIVICSRLGEVWFDPSGGAYRICEPCALERGLVPEDPLKGQCMRDYELGDEGPWRGA
jgi:hypothetical protein